MPHSAGTLGPMHASEPWTPILGSKPPAWLEEGAANADVCLSSRVRVGRNLAGHRFTHRADSGELRAILKEVLKGFEPLQLEVHRGISPAERDRLVASRLISPEFPIDRPGRAVLLDGARSVSVMINEEDHIRLQVLSAGWQIDGQIELADRMLAEAADLSFAHSPSFGFLLASPFNSGDGVRLSAMFHLIALATTRRLPKVLKALDTIGVVSRGLFGEASRAIGAYLQISVNSRERTKMSAAAEVLISEERAERQAVGRETLILKAEEAARYAIGSRKISLADSLRVLGWIRWAAAERLERHPNSVRIVDTWLTELELTHGDSAEMERKRAVKLRSMVESARHG